jgi:hypothetical protein
MTVERRVQPTQRFQTTQTDGKLPDSDRQTPRFIVSVCNRITIILVVVILAAIIHYLDRQRRTICCWDNLGGIDKLLALEKALDRENAERRRIVGKYLR